MHDLIMYIDDYPLFSIVYYSVGVVLSAILLGLSLLIAFEVVERVNDWYVATSFGLLIGVTVTTVTIYNWPAVLLVLLIITPILYVKIFRKKPKEEEVI